MKKRVFELTTEDAHILFRFGPNLLHHRYIWDSPRHSNINYELHIVLHGSCTMEVEDDTFTLSAGDAVIIAPGIYHAAQANSGPFERFTITFSSVQFSPVSDLLKVIAPYARMAVPLEIRSLCSAIMRECSAQALYHEDLLHFQLGQLLVFLLRQLSVLEKNAEGKWHGRDGNISEELLNMDTVIEAFFAKNMANYGIMQQLADSLHISKRQLCRLIPKLYGMTFREKLLDTRMDYAAWLLRTTETSTPDICKQVGYSSEPTFYTNFKHHHGISPAQYRRKYQNLNSAKPEPTNATKGRPQP